MAEIRLSPAARQDFLEIGDYTRDRWSEAQAERYLRQILAMIAEIGTHPFAGKEEASLRPGYRRRRSGSDIIFYTILEGGRIEVVRIIHERADHAGKLDE
ncbi:type II toxin-antitoxin system RelE/ParE family toxin [Rhizobium wuzhouense]|uniref:Toxin n=1 Tax=Rhizobium wuzhouense TaxID=1986026 RepID=A0ABX5NVS1_9HYPH|nr:type II toxin-antitoxin system RelE/ParE family toxin [Rhizobium wuzhouense]PYB77280.1 plasmid stabilization protein ParE [Rhizobium wuzhouense]